MKAPVVRIKIRVRLSGGSRPFLDPVLAGNKKLKPFYAIVDGKAVHHPEGKYFLRYAKNGKRIWEPIDVGNDPQLALAEREKREKSLEAQAVGSTRKLYKIDM
jgi:hypothetical protein